MNLTPNETRELARLLRSLCEIDRKINAIRASGVIERLEAENETTRAPRARKKEENA